MHALLPWSCGRQAERQERNTHQVWVRRASTPCAIAVALENLELEHLVRPLGRAWSDSENDIYSLINVVIGLNDNEAAINLAKQQERMDIQSREQLALVAENNRRRTQLDGINQKLASVMAAVQVLQDSAGGKPACRLTLAMTGENR